MRYFILTVLALWLFGANTATLASTGVQQQLSVINSNSLTPPPPARSCPERCS